MDAVEENKSLERMSFVHCFRAGSIAKDWLTFIEICGVSTYGASSSMHLRAEGKSCGLTFATIMGCCIESINGGLKEIWFPTTCTILIVAEEYHVSTIV